MLAARQTRSTDRTPNLVFEAKFLYGKMNSRDDSVLLYIPIKNPASVTIRQLKSPPRLT